MKKFLGLSLAAVLAVSALGCGGTPAPVKPKPPVTPPAAPAVEEKKMDEKAPETKPEEKKEEAKKE